MEREKEKESQQVAQSCDISSRRGCGSITVSLCCCAVVMTQGGGGIEREEPRPSDAGGADRDGERERQLPAVPRRSLA